MNYNTLISIEEFNASRDLEWVIVDCRFSLDNTERGRKDYFTSHIPRAVYAHLDTDLSGPPTSESAGRHPLPSVEALTAKLSSWGIANNTQVVAYDDGPGALASRLWWLMNWLGHSHVAVLDGGWEHWKAGGHPTDSKVLQPKERTFVPSVRSNLLVDAAEVLEARQNGISLLDARAAERFRGDNEPLDTVAGHIPGAVCMPFTQNLDTSGTFLSSQSLRERFQEAHFTSEDGTPIFYCGSGVTACHNLLAYAHAGLGEARLYAGSWSDWITDPSRPVATDE